MTPQELEVQLMQVLALHACELEDEFPLEGVASFEEAGVMTYNRGVVLRMEDGAEYQLTIVQSAQPRRAPGPYVVEPAGWCCAVGHGPYATEAEAEQCEHCLPPGDVRCATCGRVHDRAVRCEDVRVRA